MIIHIPKEMKAIASTLFLYEVLLAYTLDCSQSPSFMPVSSNVQLSNQLPTPIQAIVPSLRFECQSLITGGNVRAVGASKFDVQVWRPQDNVGNLYNLVWRREFRSRISIGSSNVNALVNSSFSMSPGVPVRRGDVIGFYSLEPARVLYSSSQQDEIIYTRASQGPLCNISLITDTNLQRMTTALPFISLTYVNVTNQDIQAVEQRLPLIGNSCTITTIPDDISTTSIPTTTATTVTITSALSNTLPSTRDDDRQQATTSTIVSDVISGSPTTEGSSESDNDQFLSLSLLEFILLVVILAVIVIAVFIVITVTCCCCLHVQRVRVESNSSEATINPDETRIPMNMNPVYQAVKSQNLIQTDYSPCVVSQSQHMPSQVPSCSTGQDQLLTYTTEPQPTATMSTHKIEQQCSLATMSGVGKQLDTTSHQIRDRAVHQQSLHESTSNYSYPNLRVQRFQGHQCQYTADGYIIIQPDQYRQGSHGCNSAAKCGTRGILDNTL